MNTRAEKLQARHRQLDLERMKAHNDWPMWPVLPIKKRVKNSSPECAILFADGRPTVIKTGLYALDDLPGKSYAEKFAGLQKQEYPTFEALVADGWEVD